MLFRQFLVAEDRIDRSGLKVLGVFRVGAEENEDSAIEADALDVAAVLDLFPSVDRVIFVLVFWEKLLPLELKLDVDDFLRGIEIPKLRGRVVPELRPKILGRRPMDAFSDLRGRLRDLVRGAEKVLAIRALEKLACPVVPLPAVQMREAAHVGHALLAKAKTFFLLF